MALRMRAIRQTLLVPALLVVAMHAASATNPVDAPDAMTVTSPRYDASDTRVASIADPADSTAATSATSATSANALATSAGAGAVAGAGAAAGDVRDCPARDAIADRLVAHPSAPGVQLATIAGDPKAPGFFKYRLSFPAGFAARPHRHGVDLHMTVLCGGVQLRLRDDDGWHERALGAGGYQDFPADSVHAEASAAGALLEITGIGPVTTTAVALPGD